MSRIRKQNHGLKRALRAIRRPAPNLCRLTLPNSRQTVSNTKAPSAVTPGPVATSIDTPQTNPVNKRSSPRLRARAHVYEPNRGRGLGYREVRSQPTTPSRRSLVRRSQKFSGRQAVPVASYIPAPYATQTPLFPYNAEWPQTSRPYTSHMMASTGLHAQPHPTISSGNPLLETEKDLFAPQNLVPWL
ncbi:unnamed protein product [Echinostoma caproni]|uniref:Uncharacterized protein n=1 Tax=Echinostoma caproni TaxID=27848 RepID=A0A3P8DYK1_9TREM|nr:unnamed protein product [Echinostoma caproni]